MWLTRRIKTKNIKQLGVQRYYYERKTVRDIAMATCPLRNTVLELYAGNGGMTKVYKAWFKNVITVDKDKNSTAQYKMDAMSFILAVLPRMWFRDGTKIDLVDFDAYGNPSYEVQAFFDVVKDTMKPIVVVITDGLGLRMKRVRDEKGTMARYLVASKSDFNLSRSWDEHPRLTMNMVNKIGEKYNMVVTPLSILQGQGKNFVFSSWLLT